MIGKRHNETDKQVNYWVHVTERCNWTCTYCIANTHTSPKTEQDKVLKMISKIPDGSFISLTGGEIGMLDKSEIDDIFNLTKSKNLTVCVDTNGMFLRKFPEYYNYVFDYFYHCSEKLLTSDEIFIDDPDNKISYMIVVDNENYDRSFEFIKKHDILFHVHGAMKNKISVVNLDRMNALKLFHFCSKQSNVNREHLKYILNYYSSENDNEYLDSRKC